MKTGARSSKVLAVCLLLLSGGVALAAGTPAIVRMDHPHPRAKPVFFKHWKHQRAFKCYACHPSPFQQTEKSVFSHKDMNAGKYCGTCHNGEDAFHADDADTCKVCHAKKK